MTRQKCPNCGNEIDQDHPLGLCPSCLLKDTMQAQTHDPIVAPAGEGDRIKQALEEKLRSQYRIIRLLGRGGMGAVYLARDLTLEREVAIKVVNTASDSSQLYDRFRREARTAARLSHPNVVPLHAFGEVEGMPYFVMGYVRGESLATRLRRDGRIPEDEGRRIIGEIAQALDHAHRMGVIHRDVKPDNILLDDETGRALLTDFGIARATGTGEALTQFGAAVGTPHFMSPEQIAGHGAVDGRSDIYSLGVMGYAMLAGRLPFEGSTAADVLTRHLTQEPPSLRSVAPAVSDGTVQAVERCLAKDPATRWQDARSLAQVMGATEVAQLPDSLHGVEGRGFAAFMLGVTIILLYWPLEMGLPRTLLAGYYVVLWAFCYVFVLIRLRREGFSFGQSQGVIWREPAWWLFWYPPALRRRGNVWSRLPVTVRHFRIMNSIFVLLCFVVVFIVVLSFGGTAARDAPGALPFDLANMIMAILAAMLVLWYVLRSRAMGELKRAGIDSLDAFRVLVSIPTSRVSFWARPHIAAILAPSEPAEQLRSDSPHDHLQSILRHGNELSGPLRPLGAQAAVAARQLIASIEQSDREMAELVRNIDPGEEERLVEKIEALAGDDYAPLRTLLQQQLELIRELSARMEQIRDRRNRRLEMMKTLSLHVASLRARLTETPTELRQVSDNVRALCDEIGLQRPPADIDGNDMVTVAKA